MYVVIPDGSGPSRGGEEDGQPTAEDALKKLESLIGEWTLEAIPPGGEPWPAGRGPRSVGTSPVPT